MSDRNWTPEQSRVIRERGRNILVSAAAGSGKTAVLVERIISKITDPVHPLDIDRILVVTFTRAAAGEMKDRIRKAIEERLPDDPENEHLQRQSILLHQAHISTIHGFCTYVIQNYFHRTDLDPSYRIGNDGEMKMLRQDVLSDLLEAAFTDPSAGSSGAEPEDPPDGGEEAAGGSRKDAEAKEPLDVGQPDGGEIAAGGRRMNAEAGTESLWEDAESYRQFLDFADSFGRGRSGRDLENIISRIYDFAISNPEPERWLQNARKECGAQTEEQLEETGWFRQAEADADALLKDVLREAERLHRITTLPDGPAFYEEALLSDLDLLEGMLHAGTYGERYRRFQEKAWEKLGRKKKGDVFRPDLQEQVKKGRDRYKKRVDDIGKMYYRNSPEEVLEELSEIRPMMDEAVRLSLAFLERYRAAKKEKNLLDFSDLEHYALDILTEQKDGGWIPSDAARELSERFDEVMTDEYQDSNFLQERLLEAVSGVREGRNNRFMVGDMKQSIYAFRLARPELFLDKYRSYREREDSVRIDLGRNFRSRREVLDLVNSLFGRLMRPDLGKIDYDGEQALYPGAAYPEDEDGEMQPELLLLDRSAPAFEEDHTRDTAIASEAGMIAERILELMRSGYVTENGEKRPVHFRDIVILLRSDGGWFQPFIRVLQASGIPAYATTGKGYFSTQEVVTVLNYLRILDNPRQEIPFAAVLRSPICGCGDPELAEIRSVYPEFPMYEAAVRYAEEGKNEPLRGRLNAFLETWRQIRGMVPYLPVHEIVEQVLERTGYRIAASAMPAGAQREANLGMLVEKAVEFEAGSQHGLFRFIRYVENLEKYEVDSGEVNLFGEEADTVRIMTIHKSKGLEFPIVFVAGCGKQFNTGDQKERVVLHAAEGIGMDAVDLPHRVIRKSLMKTAISREIKRDQLGEELRILYVAMTRAREKLILTGSISDPEQYGLISTDGKAVIKERIFDDDGAVPYSVRLGAGSCLDWICSALSEDTPVRIRMYGEKVLAKEEDPDLLEKGARLLAEAAANGSGKVYDPEIAGLIRETESFRYPYESSASLPAKLSVSEIKRKDPEEAPEEERGTEMFQEEPVIPLIPAFMREKEPEQPAARGTAYHSVLEKIDYGRAASGDAVREQIREMVRDGRVSREEADIVRPEDIFRLVSSPLGRRMKDAEERGDLRREQPFVADIPAQEIDPDWPPGEEILVQGVIDAYFLENDAYVIVDYKTDRVRTRDGSDLIGKYRKQLDFYARAVTQITGRQVSERWIYSTALRRAIPV